MTDDSKILSSSSKSLDTWKATRMWVDAYTATLEASFDAAMNPEIRSEVGESLKATKSQAVQTGAQQDIQIANSQQRIANAMGRFSMEHYQLFKDIWKRAGREISAAAWDMTQAVTFAEDPDQRLRFWQGDIPTKNFIILDRNEASFAIKFLRFVEAQSGNMDPIAYTKSVLERQGINEHNFDQYADKLAIINPWKPLP